MNPPITRTLLALPLLALLAACDPGEADRVPAPEGIASAEPAPVPAAAGPFAPRNDCAAVPGAQDFLDQVAAAVEARDVDAFVNLADVHVRLGFGGVDGAANLRESLQDADGGMWEEIDVLLDMGCAAVESDGFTTITLPWYFAQDMEGDPFETMIVTGIDVPLRRDAADDAPVVTSVSWDAVDLVPDVAEDGVRVFGGPDGSGWRKVRTRGANPQEGFMRENQLRSVVDYRMLAQNGDGKWKISALLAGD